MADMSPGSDEAAAVSILTARASSASAIEFLRLAGVITFAGDSSIGMNIAAMALVTTYALAKDLARPSNGSMIAGRRCLMP
jgi:hypothetical protein